MAIFVVFILFCLLFLLFIAYTTYFLVCLFIFNCMLLVVIEKNIYGDSLRLRIYVPSSRDDQHLFLSAFQELYQFNTTLNLQFMVSWNTMLKRIMWAADTAAMVIISQDSFLNVQPLQSAWCQCKFSAVPVLWWIQFCLTLKVQ